MSRKNRRHRHCGVPVSAKARPGKLRERDPRRREIAASSAEVKFPSGKTLRRDHFFRRSRLRNGAGFVARGRVYDEQFAIGSSGKARAAIEVA
jgi:hypothetical protein